LNNDAFHIGNITIHWYGVLIALGFVAGFWTASRRARLVNFPPERVLDLGPWLILGSILGARVLYVISYWKEQFAHNLTEIIMIHHGGLVYYGGLIGASLTFILYTRWKKLPLWTLADIVAPSIALGYAFGRIGCLMNGCCYGRVCDLPWAVRFPNQSAVWEQHFQQTLVGAKDASAPVHPTQIYEALLSLAVYAFLAWLFRHRRFNGQIFAAYLVAYSLTRSLVEFFRGDYPVHYLGGWATPAQLVSLFILAAGLALFWLLPRTTAARTK
jgi:phosphatidylglycerol:prolipoprotein diacylglycerol transferase